MLVIPTTARTLLWSYNFCNEGCSWRLIYVVQSSAKEEKNNGQRNALGKREEWNSGRGWKVRENRGVDNTKVFSEWACEEDRGARREEVAY